MEFEDHFPILSVIDNDFYFGIGGLGDFVLLLSTFYDDVKGVDIVFVANNVKQIKEFSKLFIGKKGIRKVWIYPNEGFFNFPNGRIDAWNKIANHPLCQGTGVTPKEFDYYGEWDKVKETNVFEYYGVKKDVKFITKAVPVYKNITIQPFGGLDANRISEMPREFIEGITEIYKDQYEIFLIGSPKDRDTLGNIPGARWLTDLEDSLHKIAMAEFHVGVNSWAKSLSGILGIPTYIWPSSYRDLSMYPNDKDPADWVFIENWGFKNALELLQEVEIEDVSEE